MSRLAELRNQLSRLRRRRRSVRLTTAYLALVAAALWTLAGIFLIDWQLSMTRGQRLVGVAIGVGVMIWAARRYALPLLGQAETDLDVALLVERQQGIDSDLVAALQFESAEAARWGSKELEGAVIGYVADFSRGWKILEGLSMRQLARRAATVIVTVALLAVGVAMYPNYVWIFFARLAMGSEHYPTRTQIELVEVNGAVIQPGDSASKAGQGLPVKFVVILGGELPEDKEHRRIELKSVANGSSRSIELTPAGAAKPGEAKFQGDIPQFIDSLDYQVFAGDAWTDPARLEVIPLPVVEPKLTPTPPAYARQEPSSADLAAGSRQLAVLEGSSVDLEITCQNKSLTSAVLTIDKKAYPLVSDGAEGRRWRLATAGSPLAQVDSQVRYEIQVTDSDGLHLEHPMEGSIRIKPDSPPTVTASAKVRFFLPTSGVPKIEYSANDDYGISELLLHVEIIRAAGNTPAESIRLPTPTKLPALRSSLPVDGVYPFPLAPYKLDKGDQVRLSVEAVDYRGDRPGKSTTSETISLQITDESGILANLNESDQKAFTGLDELIHRQTRTGEKQ